MSIYKKSTIISAIVTVVTLVLSLLFTFCDNKIGVWLENVCIGVFASGLLMLFSSGIGYLVEEQKCLREYCWKIKELKDKIINLQTLPENTSTINEYYDAIMAVNSLLRSYFAIIDNDFFFDGREKIQKLYEIQYKLEPFNKMSSDAAICIGQYRTRHVDKNGNRTYPKNKFNEDIQDFMNTLDNFDNSGMPLACWLEEKEKEYSILIWKKRK